MTESNQPLINTPNNDGLALQLFKEECCSQCSCQRESAPILETDALGREKFWEDIGRP